MRITGFQCLRGPNLDDDYGGLVIATEVPQPAAAGLLAAGVAEHVITCIRSHKEATRYILTEPTPGDLEAININIPERILELLDLLGDGPAIAPATTA